MKDIKSYIYESNKQITKNEYPMKKKETYGDLDKKMVW